MPRDVIMVEVGGTYRATWVSSGNIVNSICFNLRTGSETLVSSYAGVDSGNGFYYADAIINTPGLFKGEWYAFIGGNQYRKSDRIQAFPGDTDQPGRYITYDEVVLRYRDFAKAVDNAVLAASHYITYAENEIDMRLAMRYPTPFSNNNYTVKDLAIDLCYLKTLMGKSDLYTQLKEEIDEKFAALNSGTMVMVIAGTVLDPPSQAWSNTQGYKSFATQTLPIEDWVPDSQQFWDEATERGYVVDG